MPNWCDCDLYVEGNKWDIEHFKDFAREGVKPLSEECFIPYPKKFRDMDEEARLDNSLKDGFNSGGYEWCKENWGTKWGICEPTEPVVYPKKNKLFYAFQTAWSPPIPIILAMSKKFERLKFTLKYYEGANCFKGTYICKNGVVISQTDKEYRGSRGG